MASTILYPNGDGTNEGWVNEAASSSNVWQSVDEGTTSPNDSDWASAISNVSIAFLLTNMPGDFLTALSLVIKVRLNRIILKGGDRQFSTCGVYQSNESTALTGTCDLTSTTTSATTYTFTPSITGATDKTSWDGAVLKFNTLTGTSGTALILAAQIDLTYDPVSSGRIHRAAGLAGLGGAGQQQFNPVLMSRPLWTPPRKSIYVPAFTLAK